MDFPGGQGDPFAVGLHDHEAAVVVDPVGGALAVLPAHRAAAEGVALPPGVEERGVGLRQAVLERARASYDRELAGGELVQGPPGIDAELSFRRAEELMAHGQWAQPRPPVADWWWASAPR